MKKLYNYRNHIVEVVEKEPDRVKLYDSEEMSTWWADWSDFYDAAEPIDADTAKWFTIGCIHKTITGEDEELWMVVRQRDHASGFFNKKLETYGGGQLFTYRAEAEEICKELNKEA